MITHPSDKPIWYPSDMVDAQFAHFFAGMSFVLIGNTMGNLFAGAWVALGWAILKEFGLDSLIEKDSTKNNAIDAAFYMIGAVAAFGLVKWIA